MTGRRFVRMGLALVLLPLSTFVSGCQRLERAEECRSVWSLVNPNLREIDQERTQKPEDPRAYEGIAARYMLLSGALAQLKIDNKRLQDPISEYQRILQDASHDARGYAEALTSKDATKIALAKGAASRTTKREVMAVAKLDATCRSNK
jgi:hypothetical protein